MLCIYVIIVGIFVFLLSIVIYLLIFKSRGRVVMSIKYTIMLIIVLWHRFVVVEGERCNVMMSELEK